MAHENKLPQRRERLADNGGRTARTEECGWKPEKLPTEFIVALCVQREVGKVCVCIRFNPGGITPIEQFF